jgi:hypothetical protein
MAGRHFGEIDGIEEGTLFKTRKALSDAGVHRPDTGGNFRGPERRVGFDCPFRWL